MQEVTCQRKGNMMIFKAAAALFAVAFLSNVLTANVGMILLGLPLLIVWVLVADL